MSLFNTRSSIFDRGNICVMILKLKLFVTIVQTICHKAISKKCLPFYFITDESINERGK